ncbi:MAG: hypothetical protein ACP5PJ_03790 [Acidimicrobiales bacterium]
MGHDSSEALEAMKDTTTAFPRWLSVYLIVVPMTLVAQLAHRSDLIFPEAAALTLGTWGGESPPWSRSLLQLVLLPPLAAAIGVGSVALHIPAEVAFITLIVGIPLVLSRLDSPLIPTISAGALPTLLQIGSPWFLVVVTVISALLGLGMWAGTQWRLHRVATQSASPDTSPDHSPAAGHGPVESDTVERDAPEHSMPMTSQSMRRRALGYFIGLSLIWTLIAYATLPHAALAPPLLVSFYEWLSTQRKGLARYGRRWLTISGAVIIGTVAHQLSHDYVLSAIVALTATYLVMRLAHEVHPPTLAISLLPLIFPTSGAPLRVVAVCLAVAVLYGLGLVAPMTASYLHRFAPPSP